MNVLNDDVANAVDQTKALATDDTGTAHADDRLVRGDSDTLNGSLVIGAGSGRVATAPARRIQIDGILARAATGVGIGDAALAVGAFARGA